MGSEGVCGRGDALLGAAGVAVSPDGRTLFVAAAGAGGIAWLARDPANGRPATRGLRDGRAARAAAALHAVAALRGGGDRRPADGRDLDVASPETSTLQVLPARPRRRRAPCACSACRRPAWTGRARRRPDLCARRRAGGVSGGLRGLHGRAARGVVTAFARDPSSGRLAETACAGRRRAGRRARARTPAGIRGAEGVAVSPDGRDVYVAARRSQAVASFRVAAGGRLRADRLPAARAAGARAARQALPPRDRSCGRRAR